jgi:hypothetical protein
VWRAAAADFKKLAGIPSLFFCACAALQVMPRTRSQRIAAAPKKPTAPKKSTAPKKPTAGKPVAGKAAVQARTGKSTSGKPATQSSIPGISVAEIRSVLGDMRRMVSEIMFIRVTDEVQPNRTWLMFSFEYVRGVALKRHAKHTNTKKRDSERVRWVP